MEEHGGRAGEGESSAGGNQISEIAEELATVGVGFVLKFQYSPRGNAGHGRKMVPQASAHRAMMSPSLKRRRKKT